MIAVHEGILDAILAEPQEIIHRHALADWLDDESNGTSKQSRLIRLQIELEQTKPCFICKQPRACPACLEFFRLADEEARLLQEVGREVTASLGLDAGEVLSAGEGADFHFWRGCIQKVTCDLAFALHHLWRVVARQPVEGLCLRRNSVPLYPLLDGYAWLCSGPDIIQTDRWSVPPEIFDCLLPQLREEVITLGGRVNTYAIYPDRKGAVLDLGLAALRFARKTAAGRLRDR